MDLNSIATKKLLDLIKDSFRVRKNVRPIYVDVSGNLSRLGAPQHQIIFGRRGSGKSCLLVEFLKTVSKGEIAPIYILADEFKRLAYPDILIRLLVEILEALSTRRPWWKRLVLRQPATRVVAKNLRDFLDVAEESEIIEGRHHKSSDEATATLQAGTLGGAKIGSSTGTAQSRTARFRERKIDSLERHLRDYKDAIAQVTKQWGGKKGSVLVDDFYLVAPDSQADVIDYLHRLLRDTDIYLKVATIRHRTRLLKNQPQTVGVELGQDVEEVDLDRTLEDLDRTQAFLNQMLGSMGKTVGVERIDQLFNPDAFQALTLASGGVPRDASGLSQYLRPRCRGSRGRVQAAMGYTKACL